MSVYPLVSDAFCTSGHASRASLGCRPTRRLPAADLFGDPDEPARADALEYGSTEADAALAESVGVRDVLAVTGLTMLVLGVIAGGVALVGGAGPIDVALRAVAMIAAMTGAFVAGGGAAAFRSVGRRRTSLWWGAAAVVLILVGATAAGLSDDALIADAPRWAVALALLLPGILVGGLALVVPARRAPQIWTDDEWFARFRGVMQARGVAAGTVDEHERSLRAELARIRAEWREFTAAAAALGAPSAP